MIPHVLFAWEKVEVALRDPTAFAHPPHWAVAPDDGDGSDGSSSSVASGLRVLPVFVLSDLAIGPSFSGDSDGDGDGGGVPLAFDHGLLVRRGGRVRAFY